MPEHETCELNKRKLIFQKKTGKLEVYRIYVHNMEKVSQTNIYQEGDALILRRFRLVI